MKAHSEETRAQVIAALLAGQGVREISRQYNVPRSSVSRIKQALSSDEQGQIGTQKRERIAELVETHLVESLKAAASLAQKVTNNDWFIKQNAADIGVLYGILTDKSIRILEAAENSQIQQDTDPDTVH